MNIQKKPYIIVPYLIEQSTWGGTYICEKKGWTGKQGITGKKIGQSYELYSETKLALNLKTTNDPSFGPEYSDVIDINIFKESRPFPLIKFTQAKGNSFQLHIRPSQKDPHWQPKAESWYYFENGKITFGIKKGADIEAYKKTCHAINEKMKELSRAVIEKKMGQQEASQEAQEYIKISNPWQYVNVHNTKAGDVVDLSGGGLHHSWEEDSVACPLGNIVYEVQQDVMDPYCTIRSFDQGKLKGDGTIRTIQIDDYFKYLDLDEKRNTLNIEKKENGILFDTPLYSLSSLLVVGEMKMESKSSFHHLFVKEGEVSVVDSNNNKISVGRGHSCFIPNGILYTIQTGAQAELLLTYLR
ncbi:MAG: hypothetical protein WAV30_01275 [Microgenomates group bacterium]